MTFPLRQIISGSLAGAQGFQGAQGAQGFQGAQGAQGVQGSIGDKYQTTSSTTFSLETSGLLTIFTDQTNLSYSVGQSVIVAYDVNHIQHGTVVSYVKANGQLIINRTSREGTGTYPVWTVNLDGAVGGAVRMSDLVDLVADQDIVPSIDATYNLGSPANKFSSLYLSGNTIVLGNTTIKSDDSGGGIVLSQTGSNAAPVILATNTLKSLAAPIIENSAVISENYAVSNNKNAISYGPVKLNSNITFTIQKSSKWKILA